MKFDLHCHTKEGSLDSKVSVKEFVHKFMALGFNGFMISDHNSYKGCRAWDKIKNDPRYKDFCVIRGVEYDTKDAGHILVIMPDDLYLPIMKIRGMRCSKLIKIVHIFGGILGPAHPFGVASSSAMGFKKMDMRLLKRFDFIEAFNTCESRSSNSKAALLAKECGLPTFAGSDSHVSEYIGMACTDISENIYCNNQKSPLNLQNYDKCENPLNLPNQLDFSKLLRDFLLRPQNYTREMDNSLPIYSYFAPTDFKARRNPYNRRIIDFQNARAKNIYDYCTKLLIL